MIAEDNQIESFEIEELLMHVLWIDENDEEYAEKIETWLYENYGIEDPEALYRIIRQITPLIDKNPGGISWNLYKWFAIVLPDQGDWNIRKKWLLKIPA